MKIKGTQLHYNLIDFKKVVTMTSLTQTFIDGHESNNGTLKYEQCVEQIYSFLWLSVCLKIYKQMKREKKYSEQCFLLFCYFVVKVIPTQGYFRFRDINRTKQ